MGETEQKSLEEVLFGSERGAPIRPDADLAEAISAWFRASRAKLRDGATWGTPASGSTNAPRWRREGDSSP